MLLDKYDGSPKASLLKKAFDYRIWNDILWIHGDNIGTFLPCIPESKVLTVLTEAYDGSGHWAKAGTMARIRGRCYWPGQSQDVEGYIAGCIEYAKHGPAVRSQPLHPIKVTYPF